jgi:hypothetical protein
VSYFLTSPLLFPYSRKLKQACPVLKQVDRYSRGPAAHCFRRFIVLRDRRLVLYRDTARPLRADRLPDQPASRPGISFQGRPGSYSRQPRHLGLGSPGLPP